LDWLTVHYFWEAQRMAPRGLVSMEGFKNLLDTPHGQLRWAGNTAGCDVLVNDELRLKFAEAGVDQVEVYVTVQDAQDSDGQDGDVRYRRKGQLLTVTMLVLDDARQETPDQFRDWMRVKLLAALVPWLDKKRKKVA
jgi:hypothetical protein